MSDTDDWNDHWWAQQALEEQRQASRQPSSTTGGNVKTSQMVQSKFLKKDDFPTPEVLTIRGCALEEVAKGETKWVLFFNEKTKGVVLNVTKIRQLEAAYGGETDDWLGKKIKVSNDPTVMMGQQVVGGIKFNFPSSTPAAAAAAPPMKPPPSADIDFDDDIPF